ncbi:MAG TPA: bifunctional metallophosphatase/5'-nucleotidase [Vicinamibacterales bacterium]|nr:bifunctional metallophosphatase/5'-nucleotidase [Vicinamibacterales bacterium]
MSIRRSLAAACVAAALTFAGCTPHVPPQAPSSAGLVDVHVLAFNDFHGHLDPPDGANGRIGTIDAGGVEYLTARLKQLRALHPNTITVSAGDNIGASPLLSGMFHDEPTIEALSDAGLDVSTVGNHELDEGWWELYRMQKGGCHPVDGCQDGTPFAGARFEYLSANVLLDPTAVEASKLAASGWRATGAGPQTLFPASTVRTIDGVKIGFIGLALEGTPTIVSSASLRGLTFRPEADAANDAAAALVRQGVRTIVVLIHQGGRQSGGTYDTCEHMSGPILDIVHALSPEIDVVISGHTHEAYNCRVDGRLLTSAASYGRLITDVDLRIDRATGDVASSSATNAIVTRDLPKDAASTALVDRYRPFAKTLGDRVVGSIAVELPRAQNAAGEAPLGDVVADAYLAAARAQTGGADAAFTNSGGIRGDLLAQPPATPDGPRQVTYAQTFAVLPFGNRVVVKTLSGEALLRLLEQQFDNPRAGSTRMLQVSSGVSYAYDRARPAGARVDRASVRIGDAPLDPARRYRIVTNDFVWGGGDGFTVAQEGTDPVDVGADVDVMVAYIAAHSPVPPAPLDRIHRVP